MKRVYFYQGIFCIFFLIFSLTYQKIMHGYIFKKPVTIIHNQQIILLKSITFFDIYLKENIVVQSNFKILKNDNIATDPKEKFTFGRLGAIRSLYSKGVLQFNMEINTLNEIQINEILNKLNFKISNAAFSGWLIIEYIDFNNNQCIYLLSRYSTGINDRIKIVETIFRINSHKECFENIISKKIFFFTGTLMGITWNTLFLIFLFCHFSIIAISKILSNLRKLKGKKNKDLRS